MLTKYGNDASVTAMVDKLDWVIMPVFNVDGYEYSHTTVSLISFFSFFFSVSLSFIILTSHGPVESGLGYLTTDKQPNGTKF